jgi:hypothetical protein
MESSWSTQDFWNSFSRSDFMIPWCQKRCLETNIIRVKANSLEDHILSMISPRYDSFAYGSKKRSSRYFVFSFSLDIIIYSAFIYDKVTNCWPVYKCTILFSTSPDQWRQPKTPKPNSHPFHVETVQNTFMALIISLLFLSFLIHMIWQLTHFTWQITPWIRHEIHHHSSSNARSRLIYALNSSSSIGCTDKNGEFSKIPYFTNNLSHPKTSIRCERNLAFNPSN